MSETTTIKYRDSHGNIVESEAKEFDVGSGCIFWKNDDGEFWLPLERLFLVITVQAT